MPGEPPLDGSPDPVEPEPDSFDQDAERTKSQWQGFYSLLREDRWEERPFDLATDSIDPERLEEYEEWLFTHDPQPSGLYRTCKECGLAQNNNRFPPPGALRREICLDCADQIPVSQRFPRDPTITLNDTKVTDLELSLDLPITTAEPETRQWRLLDSPLRSERVHLFTTPGLGLLLQQSPGDERLEQYQLTDWQRSYIAISDNGRGILEDLGLSNPLRTGVTIRLDVPWAPTDQAWRFLLLTR